MNDWIDPLDELRTGPWIDISLPLAPDSIPWAGLGPPRLTSAARIAAGDSVNVGILTACLHTATHVDAPNHVRSDGATIETVALDAYLGPARLVHLPHSATIDLPALVAAGLSADGPWPERLLVGTGQGYDGVHWPANVPHVTIQAATACVARGVKLLGVDVPSVDPLDSTALAAHRTLFDGGVAILENVRVAQLDAGDYWLAAVPLAIVGGDASPVRAVVRRLAGGL